MDKELFVDGKEKMVIESERGKEKSVFSNLILEPVRRSVDNIYSSPVFHIRRDFGCSTPVIGCWGVCESEMTDVASEDSCHTHVRSITGI